MTPNTISYLYKEYGNIFLALFTAVIPVAFVWHTELVFQYTGRNFTNGFLSFDGLEIYHVLMYLTFLANWFAAGYILKSGEKL